MLSVKVKIEFSVLVLFLNPNCSGAKILFESKGWF